MLEQRAKQKAIDAMEFEIYENEEEDKTRYVQFHDFLFACVQRAYKKEDPSKTFGIDDHHKENLRDETKEVLAMPIKTSQYLMARRLTQAYRDHRTRKQILATLIKKPRYLMACKMACKIAQAIRDHKFRKRFLATMATRETIRPFECKQEAADEKTPGKQ